MNLIKSLTVFAVLVTGTLFAQDKTLYCPDSESDADGDGWGWENNMSCVVLTAADDIPICGDPDLDTDGDGWGFEQGQSCLVDNLLTQVPTNGGIVSIPHNRTMPAVSVIRSSPVEYLRAVVKAKDGTVYAHMPAPNLFSALNQNGDVIWQVQIADDNSVDRIQLDREQKTLYLKMAAGQIASYDINGNFNWMTASFELVYDYKVTGSSIVVRRGDWVDSSTFFDNTIVSIALDGSTNWEFTPERSYMGGLHVDSEDNVHITMDIDGGSEIITIGSD